jgi:uncharacterized membrane protein YbhN (UPF0104 family)
MIGFYFSTFLPTTVGGDVIKATLMARQQRQRAVAVMTVVIDRVIGLVGLAWLAALVGGFCWLSGLLSTNARALSETIILGASVLVLGSVFFWLILGALSQSRVERLAGQLEAVPKVGHLVAALWRGGRAYRDHPGSVGLALVLAIVSHLGFVMVFYLSARTLSPAASLPALAAHFLLVPLGMILSLGVPTPGGIGGGELVYGSLYEMAGFPFAAGLLGSLVRRSISWGLGLVGYVACFRLDKDAEPRLFDAIIWRSETTAVNGGSAAQLLRGSCPGGSSAYSATSNDAADKS